MKRLIIYGTGHLDVIKLVDAINRAGPAFEVVGFINDLPECRDKTFMGYPVLGGREVIPNWTAGKDAVFLNNINSSISNHRKIAAVLESYGCEAASLLHPALDLNYVDCGPGAMIPEGCVIGGNVKIGRYFTCRLKSLISHNVTIGDFVYMGPGVICCGYASVGDGCFIGAGAVISTGVRLGAGAAVGAGAVVVKDVPPRMLVCGSPARVIREVREDENLAQ